MNRLGSLSPSWVLHSLYIGLQCRLSMVSYIVDDTIQLMKDEVRKEYNVEKEGKIK